MWVLKHYSAPWVIRLSAVGWSVVASAGWSVQAAWHTAQLSLPIPGYPSCILSCIRGAPSTAGNVDVKLITVVYRQWDHLPGVKEKEAYPPADPEDSTTSDASIRGFKKLPIKDQAPGSSMGLIHPDDLLIAGHLEQCYQIRELF